jgi:hypothetical protein
MDKSRLKLLAQDQEYETIEWGMEFLKTASNTSDLAARYLAMLRRVRDQTRQADVQSSETLADGLGCASSQTNNIDDASQPPLISSTAKAPWQTNSLQNPRGEFDIDGMNFDELLFGTGLPQDVFSFDYPNAAFLP